MVSLLDGLIIDGVYGSRILSLLRALDIRCEQCLKLTTLL